MSKVLASAPSNIALIKYMGKSSSEQNFPTNSSLSYTLEHLRSFVEIEALPKALTQDDWQPLSGHEDLKLTELKLSVNGRQKFLRHFSGLKVKFELPGFYRLRSANNFASDCGLASSASSFAALTRAAWMMSCSIKGLDPRETEEPSVQLSELSRLGSGSSCRSFFSPWATWSGAGAQALDLDLQLAHAVVIVDDEVKTVSSSEAHLRVSSSLLFTGRAQRAEQRQSSLIAALKSADWSLAREICWAEFWDMHALFETSQPAFGYMTAGTLACLQQLRSLWQNLGHESNGPLVTMDAGANIHLLLLPEQISEAEHWLRDFRQRGFKCLTSWDRTV